MSVYTFLNGYTRESMDESMVVDLAKVNKNYVTLECRNKFAIEVLVYYHNNYLGTDCKCYKCAPRKLNLVSYFIQQAWNPVYYAAKPYLRNMEYFESASNDMRMIPYGLESGKMAVLYFLSNAATWKGIVAKCIKAELKHMSK